MLKVSRTKRFLGSLINIVSFNCLFIGNIYLVATKGQTLGGMVMGYKYQQKGIKALIKILIGAFIVAPITWGITLGIFFIYDLVTMGKRNGWYWEKWFSMKKK